MTAVITAIPPMRDWVRAERAAGRGQERTIGLVPTMGFLHAGHLSLIHRAQQTCGRVVVSVFVNPLQFGPAEDYNRYPRDFERDRAMLEREGVDAIFHPTAEEMYSSAPQTAVTPGKLAEVLCGASRPGHFQGVATVVAKLFNIVAPDRAFFGQKDAQQVVVIQNMVRDLSFPVEIEVCPTVREPDGLAMSSRNSYLSPDERTRAVVLSQALKRAEARICAGERDAASIEHEMRDAIAAAGAELDYASVVDRGTLASVDRIDGDVLVAVAARFGKTRLIDNVIVDGRPR